MSVWDTTRTIMIVVTKSSKVIAALKLFKFGKPLLTICSLLLSVLAYGLWLGPWFGLGFALMLLIHEMGHVWAIRRTGRECNGPLFIPFIGAAVFLPDIKHRGEEAFVGIGGPMLGTMAALLCLGPYLAGYGPIWLLVSYVGVFLNLFNMIPLSPLDGGRITQVIGTWFLYCGVGALLIISLLLRSPQILLIWVLCLDQFKSWPRWVRPGVGIVLTAAMSGFMLNGYSDQPWFVDLVDVVVASFLTFLYWGADHYELKTPLSEDRPYPVKSIRGNWLAGYLSLTVFLIGLLALEAPMVQAVIPH